MQRVGRLDQNQLSERCRRFRLRLSELNSKLYAVDPTAGTLFAVLEANGSMLDGYTTLEGTLQTGLGAQGAQRREAQHGNFSCCKNIFLYAFHAHSIAGKRKSANKARRTTDFLRCIPRP